MNTPDRKAERAHIEALLGFIQPKAQEIIASGHEHAPMIFAADAAPGGKLKNVKILLVAADLTVEMKNKIADLMRAMLGRRECDLCAFVSEVWVAKAEKDNAEEFLRRTEQEGVAAQPNKTEGVMIALSTRDEQHIILNPITGSGEQRRMAIGTIEEQEGHTFEGRFALHATP